MSTNYVHAVSFGKDLIAPVENDIEICDVVVEHHGGLKYTAVAQTSRGDIPVSIPWISSKPQSFTIKNWVGTLKDIEVSAGAKVYFDIWNFVEDSALYRELWDEFERENDVRESRRSIPTVPGTVRFNEERNIMEEYYESQWVPVNTKDEHIKQQRDRRNG